MTTAHLIERTNELNDVAVHHGREQVEATYLTDENGNPTGGSTRGEGIRIDWQNGVKQPNGAILEDVIEACIDRLEFFQQSKFASEFNAAAIENLRGALHHLNARTAARKAAGTEGTYKP